MSYRPKTALLKQNKDPNRTFSPERIEACSNHIKITASQNSNIDKFRSVSQAYSTLIIQIIFVYSMMLESRKFKKNRQLWTGYTWTALSINHKYS